MKKILLGICLIGVLFLVACGGNKTATPKDSKQKECLSDLKEGLENRWDSQDGESLDSDVELYAKNVDIELSIMEKYTDVTFEDEKFDGIIQQYLGALNSQKKGVEYFLKDAKQFEDLYNVKGYDVRVECIKELVDEYKFSVDEKYQDNLENFLSGKRAKWIVPGESKEIEVDYGKLKIQIDDFKRTGWEEYDDEIDDGNYIGVIECTVENESYEDEYNPDYIIAENVILVMDDQYTVKPTYSMSYGEIDDCTDAAGGMIPSVDGAKVKVAIPYVFAENQTRAVVQLGNDYLLVADLSN